MRKIEITYRTRFEDNFYKKDIFKLKFEPIFRENGTCYGCSNKKPFVRKKTVTIFKEE